MKNRLCLFALLFFVATAWGVRAEAACPTSEGKIELGRVLFEQGRLKQSTGDFAAALELYRQSQACAADAETQLAEATMLIKLNQYAAALPLLESYVRDPMARDAESVSKIVARVKVQHVGRVQVQASEPGVSVSIDGILIGLTPLEPIWVDVGTHPIELSKDGFEPATGVVRVEGGQTTSVVLPLKRVAAAPARGGAPAPTAPPPEPSPTPDGGSAVSPPFLQDTPPAEASSGRSYAPLVTAGVGLAALGVGTYYGLSARSEWKDAEQACPNHECVNPSDLEREHDARSAADVSTGAFVVAGASLLATLVLWYVDL